ncbi:MAG: hypothetical protein CV087_09780 [Candidatus Brocadia sp. WS118]|nr:MAG: hypothetical protein CV087_09780 [Candidatus Brocadia sp. WS118]
MPTDLHNRPGKVKEARWKAVEKLTKLAGYRCEIKRIHGNTDCHEFWLTLSSKHDDEVALLILTHPTNIVVVNHDLHINQKPSFETCLKAVRRRNRVFWQELGFANYLSAIRDFGEKIQGFYRTEQLKTIVQYIPRR